MTVFLAFVIFAEMGTTAPRIEEAYRTLEACTIAACNKNLDTLNRPAKPGTGWVCLQMRASD